MMYGCFCLQVLHATAMVHDIQYTGRPSGSQLFGAGAFTQDGQRQRSQVTILC